MFLITFLSVGHGHHCSIHTQDQEEAWFIKQGSGSPPLRYDCWSVHHSKDFLAWMKQEHGKLIQIHFVPANCECTYPYYVHLPILVGTDKLQPNDQLLNHCLKHEINTMAVEWMAPAVKDSLALSEHVVSFPTDLPTLCAISVACVTPPFQAIYSLSKVEQLALREFLDDDLAITSFTLRSRQAGAPILFIKKDGSLRLVVDSWS